MDDLDALAHIYRDPEVRKYFPEGILTYEQTKEELEWIIDVYYGQHGFGYGRPRTSSRMSSSVAAGCCRGRSRGARK